MDAKPIIGWIGLGKMGAPMATRLQSGGYELHVFDVAADACAALRDIGAHVAEDAAGVARAADVIFTSLPNDAILLQLFAPGGALAESLDATKILVETSTVSPAASAQAAATIGARGAACIRAPLSGSTALAAAGTLTVLASGPLDAFERIEPIMRMFASRFFYLGEGEEARTLKLVINMMVGATSALVAEALTFGEKGGLDVKQMLDVISESVVSSPLINYKRETLEKRDYTPAFTVEQMIKDFDLVIDAARASSAPIYLISLIRQHYEAARGQGLGDRDFFALLAQYEAQAGLRQARL